MKTKGKSIIWMGLFSLVLLASGVPSLWAFQSLQVETVSMDAAVAGVISPISSLDKIYIGHSPLQGISPVSKIVIIQGTAGSDLTGYNPNFGTLQGKIVRGKATTPVIRIHVRYRFGGISGTVVTSPPQLYYTNPTPFQFTLDPNSVLPGNFEYQIVAEGLSNGIVISSASVPSEALAHADSSWVTLGVQAGAPALDVDATGGHISIPDGNPNDGETSIDIPAGVVKSPTNLSIKELAVSATEIPSYSGLPTPVAMYQMNADPQFQGAVLVHLLFPDFIPSESSWNLAGTAVNKGLLTIAFWDGYRWKNIGGKVDAVKNLVTSQISYNNFIGVFPMAAPTPKGLATFQKIIMPYGNSGNRIADFSGVDAEINIFDINGHRVRTVPDSVHQWDARDDDGKIVESGVYIYQFKLEGQLVSGVIAVAK